MTFDSVTCMIIDHRGCPSLTYIYALWRQVGNQYRIINATSHRRAAAYPGLEKWFQRCVCVGGGGVRLGPQVSKRAQNHLYNYCNYWKTVQEMQKGQFSLFLGSPGSHPGNGINGARRGRFLPVSPDMRLSSPSLPPPTIASGTPSRPAVASPLPAVAVAGPLPAVAPIALVFAEKHMLYVN